MSEVWSCSSAVDLPDIARILSSAVERFVYIEDVASSNLAGSTKGGRAVALGDMSQVRILSTPQTVRGSPPAMLSAKPWRAGSPLVPTFWLSKNH